MRLLGNLVASLRLRNGASFVLVVAVLTVVVGCASGTKSGSGEPELAPPALAFVKRSEWLTEFGKFKQVKSTKQPIALAYGAADAPIVVEDFSDYRCGHCYNALAILAHANERWPNRIRLVHRNFPLDGSCNAMVSRKQADSQSCRAAFASICAAEQGRFAQMHKGLFMFQNEPKPFSEANVLELAGKVGLNQSTLQSCMKSKSAGASLQKDLEFAERLQIEATPTIIVNGRLLPAGTPEPKFFMHLMDALVYEREGPAAEADLKQRLAR